MAAPLMVASALGACGGGAATPATQTSAIPGPPPRCPRDDRHLRFTHDERTAHRMVPAGATSLVLCAYHGLNPSLHQAGELATSRHVTGRARIVSLARLFNHLPDLPPANAPVACPMDDGSEDAALFGYSGAPKVTVAIKLTGCAFVTNGDRRRALTRRLERALPTT